MYNNFETLEKKCKTYYFKQNLKITVLLVIFVVSVSGVILFLQKDKQDVSHKVVKPKKIEVVQEVVEVKKAEPKKQKVEEVKQTIQPKVQKQIVEKKQPVIKTKYKDVVYSIEVDDSYIPHVEKQVRKKQPKKVHKKVEEKPVVKEQKPKSKRLKMSVKKVTDVKEMIDLYNKEKNYNLAIKISKAYFKKKKYTKSMLWAKKANILNRKDEKAWILYAKSEYAKGNSKRAIEILRLYLANTSSSNAKTLLLNWSEGK